MYVLHSHFLIHLLGIFSLVNSRIVLLLSLKLLVMKDHNVLMIYDLLINFLDLVCLGICTQTACHRSTRYSKLGLSTAAMCNYPSVGSLTQPA